MFLIFGSTAIKHWFPDYSRQPKDLDIISDRGFKSTKEVEIFYNKGMDYLKEHNQDKHYVDPDLLFTIKFSHLSWDINWDKHMKDFIFLKNKGCKIDYDFYELLYKEWEVLHGKKKVKMKVENEVFFKENIYRRFNHEELHNEFRFYERPLNEKIREDLNSPLCSEYLWNELSHEDKLKCAAEELFVLTSERYILVENPIKCKFAKTKMLKKMITSTTSGWFNRFLIMNFETLLNYQEEHFFQVLTKIKGK